MNQTYNVRLSNNSPRDSDDDFRLIVDNLFQDYPHSDDPTTFFFWSISAGHNLKLLILFGLSRARNRFSF